MIKNEEQDKETIYVERPLMYGTIIFIIGIIFGFYTNFLLTRSLIILGGLFLLSSFSFFKNLPFKKIIVFCLIAVLGMIWFDYNDPKPGVLEKWESEKITVTGEVLASGTQNNQYLIKLSQVNDQLLSQRPKVMVNIISQNNVVLPWGDVVSFTGSLVETLPQTNPGGFSEKEYWRQKGVWYKLNTYEAGDLIKKGTGIKATGYKIRESISEKAKLYLPQEESGVILGLILGDKDGLDLEFYQNVQKLGIAHVFAVSGLHVGFLVGLYLFLTQRMHLSNSLTLMGAIIILATYSLITGLTPSVVRASIMVILGLVGLNWLKYKDFHTIIAAAALVILITNPLNLFTIGFQLSFLTTWGLVYFFPWAKSLLSFLPEKLRIIVAVPLAAQFSALPVVIYHFNLLSFWAPLVNILVVPIVAILVPLLLVALTLSLVWVSLGEPFLVLASGIIYGLFFLVRSTSNFLSKGYIYLPSPSLGLILIYYCLLIGCKEIDFLRKRLTENKRLILSLGIILGLFFMSLPKSQSLEANFLDVGQGDGTVMVTPFKQFIVIDGGPSSNTITRYLQYRGANKVSMIILSHPDSDHINGLFRVINEFPTEFLLVPSEIEPSPLLAQLKDLAIKRNTKIIEGKVGMTLALPDGIDLQIISPEMQNYRNLNNNEGSLVIKVSYGEQDLLFTGDIGNMILKRILPDLDGIEVLKIPHHGSRNSYFPGLYSEISPEIAVISVGRSNRYNHPHPEVIKGLEEVGIKTLRTDQGGAVRLIIKKNEIETYLTID